MKKTDLAAPALTAVLEIGIDRGAHKTRTAATRSQLFDVPLTDDELNAFQSTLDVIADPEHRARIADVLWLRRRDPSAARIAVDAYVDSGFRLEDPEHWVASMERYERAVRLARQIEPKGDLPNKVLRHIESRVRHYEGQDHLYFTLKSLQLFEEFGFGDFVFFSDIAGRIASRARAHCDFERARKHFDVQARLLRRGKDMEAAESARVSHAECFIEEAEAREKDGSFMAARVFWEKALKAVRDRPSLRARLPDLQRRLAEAGKKTLEEMKRHSVEIDLSEVIEAARNSVTGLQLDDAFFTFITFNPLIDPNSLREETISFIKEHPLQSAFDATIFDEAGRKTGTRPSAITDNTQQYEAAIQGFMEQHARFHRGPTVHGCLAPAMRQVLEEHEIGEAELEELIGTVASFLRTENLYSFKLLLLGFGGIFLLPFISSFRRLRTGYVTS